MADMVLPGSCVGIGDDDDGGSSGGGESDGQARRCGDSGVGKEW